MNWKQEYLDDERGVPDFLRRHIAAAGVADPIYVPNEIETALGMGISIFSHGHCIFDASFSEAQNSMMVIGFNVHQDFRGREIGAIGVKSLLAIAYTRQSTHLTLFPVDNHGRSFWPRYGSFSANVKLSSRQILSFVDSKSDVLNAETIDALNKIARVCDNNRVIASRMLSQLNDRLPNKQYVSAALFEEMPRYDTHYILMGEVTTCPILNKRLGVLPPFRPPTHRFALYVAALQPGQS